MKILYTLVYSCWYLLSLLPLRVLYVLSDVFYFVLAKIVKYRYQVIWENVSSAFPNYDATKKKHIINNFYAWLCDYFVETVKLMTMSEAEVKRRMVFIGCENLDKNWADKRSVAVYLGHYGQWEWITSLPLWLHSDGKCTQIYHPLENKIFDKIFLKARQHYGGVCIPMNESLRKLVKYRAKGIPVVLGYIADQAPFWNNIHHWIDFLHHDTPVFTGAERMIKSTDQVVYYGDVRRVKRGYYTCEFKLMTDQPKLFPDYELTDTYFDLLEKSIIYDPSIYLWSHKRWKRTHEEYNIRLNKETGIIDLRDLETIKKEKGIQ